MAVNAWLLYFSYFVNIIIYIARYNPWLSTNENPHFCLALQPFKAICIAHHNVQSMFLDWDVMSPKDKNFHHSLVKKYIAGMSLLGPAKLLQIPCRHSEKYMLQHGIRNNTTNHQYFFIYHFPMPSIYNKYCNRLSIPLTLYYELSEPNKF